MGEEFNVTHGTHGTHGTHDIHSLNPIIDNSFEGETAFIGNECKNSIEFSDSIGFSDFSEVAADSIEVNKIASKSNDNYGNKILDYKEFESLCKIDSGISVHALYKYVVNYYIKNRNQVGSVSIEVGKSFIDNDLMSCFSGFHIIKKGEFKSIDRYIVFVDPCDVEESYLEQVELNLPNSVAPTHVCILSNDLEVIENSFKEVLDLNSNLTLVNLTSRYNVSNVLNDRVNKILSKIPTLSIASYCRELSSMYSSLNTYEFYKRFDEVVTEVLDNCKNKVVYFGGDYSNNELDMYKHIVTECCIRNLNFKFYIEDEYVSSLATSISKSLFNPSHQMVEDVAYFFKNFPKVCLEYKSNFVVVNLVLEKRMVLKLKYIPLNNLDNATVRSSRIDLDRINILPLESYFKIETDDVEFNIKEELRLRGFIKSLYRLLEIENGVIDLTNLVFFELGGVTYVGCNLGYDVLVDCRSIMGGLPDTNRTITSIDELSSFVYIPMFLDRDRFLKSIANENKSRLPLGAFAIVKSKTRKNSSIFRNTACLYTEEMRKFPNSLFLLGMDSKGSILFRESAMSKLADILGIDEVRNKIDSFGGFNSISNNVIEV